MSCDIMRYLPAFCLYDLFVCVPFFILYFLYDPIFHERVLQEPGPSKQMTVSFVSFLLDFSLYLFLYFLYLFLFFLLLFLFLLD